MNNRARGLISGAVRGGRFAGPVGAVVGGILGAVRSDNNDTTGGPQGEFDDMMSMTDEDRKNIIQGMNNGFGEL